MPYITRRIPYYEVLDEEGLQTIEHNADTILEETGIDCRQGAPLAEQLTDWQLENVYEIYPSWRHRYASDVTHNTEHLFGLRVPSGLPVTLAPREHTDFIWLPYPEAAQRCYSSSNAEACLLLPRFAEHGGAR